MTIDGTKVEKYETEKYELPVRYSMDGFPIYGKGETRIKTPYHPERLIRGKPIILDPRGWAKRGEELCMF